MSHLIHDSRTESHLAGVDERLIRLFKRVSISYPVTGDLYLHPVVTDGCRSIEEQKVLFSTGASHTMNSRHIVTRAYPKSQAIDITLFIGGKPQYAKGLYIDLARRVFLIAADMRIDIEWGGSCFGKSFFDGPHFQIPWGK